METWIVQGLRSEHMAMLRDSITAASIDVQKLRAQIREIEASINHDVQELAIISPRCVGCSRQLMVDDLKTGSRLPVKCIDCRTCD